MPFIVAQSLRTQESSLANHLSVRKVLAQILLLGILVMVWQQVQYCPQLHVYLTEAWYFPMHFLS